MHGVGQEWTLRAFKAFNLPAPTCVKEQGEPDPTFPTVAFPNPEEGKSALQLSMATADSAGATLILANDPDADRLALAEKRTCRGGVNDDDGVLNRGGCAQTCHTESDGSWKVFNGNELGVTLAHWQWTCLKKVGAMRGCESCRTASGSKPLTPVVFIAGAGEPGPGPQGCCHADNHRLLQDAGRHGSRGGLWL